MAHDFRPSCLSHSDMPKAKLAPDVRKKLEAAAAKVMKNAHAPYSNFHVGSAMLLTNGKIYRGMQRGERVLRHDQLRRTHGDFLGSR